MTTKNNMPAGYKDSAVGIIPQEWEVKRLGAIAKCFSGGTPKSESENMYGGIIPFIRSGEIHSNKTALFLTEEGLKKSSAKMVEVGDLIFALYGANSGDCAISQINGAINQAILCIRSSKVINPFLQPYLELQKDMFIAKYLQGGQGNLSGEIVNSYTIPVPPMEEQRKIAEILGVCDEAIERQSRLIEKLELRKRALMQRLLTGRTRLPGFTTPWQKRRMKDCFEHITDTSNGCEYLPMTVSARLGLISQKDKFDRVIAGDSLKKYTHIQKGDFAYNKGNSNLYEMGCIYRLKEQDAVVPFVYICFRPKQNVIGEFYHHFFINHGLDRQLKRIITSGARGDGLLNVDKTDFFELEIVYPLIAEQKAIAEVLTVADNEIATHRKRLEALRLQKRGLMQQLLTGKTRVKI
ncbi:MAG: restriction endonuclease subunit S [Alistipes sp.]|nr:restriction endonuclease subunit S [Alistipes sp.]